MSNRIKEEFIQKKEPVRLNKYLSEAGVCSRREADRLIESWKGDSGWKTGADRDACNAGTGSESRAQKSSPVRRR